MCWPSGFSGIQAMQEIPNVGAFISETWFSTDRRLWPALLAGEVPTWNPSFAHEFLYPPGRDCRLPRVQSARASVPPSAGWSRDKAAQHLTDEQSLGVPSHPRTDPRAKTRQPHLPRRRCSLCLPAQPISRACRGEAGSTDNVNHKTYS